MKPNGERRGDLRELRILERKWRRRFGPDQQVGLASVRREAEIFDFVQVGGVRLKPLRGIFFDFGEIELHRARVVIWGRLRHKSRRRDDGNQQQADGRDKNGHAASHRSCRGLRRTRRAAR